jgi:hypothetical protein
MPANEGTSWLGGSARITPKTIKKDRPEAPGRPFSGWVVLITRAAPAQA